MKGIKRTNKKYIPKVYKSQGYWMIWRPDHPNANNGQILLHRYIMSLKIGRALKSSEIVHHIDSNIENNHPDNLEILDKSKHFKYHNFRC